MGLCSGYLFKKLGKLMMLVVGFGFVWLQLLTSSGHIQVNWPLIERRFKETFDADGDGKITLNDARYGFRWLMQLLTKNFQFKATYVGGYLLWLLRARIPARPTSPTSWVITSSVQTTPPWAIRSATAIQADLLWLVKGETDTSLVWSTTVSEASSVARRVVISTIPTSSFPLGER